MSRAAVSAELVREIGSWDKGTQGPTLLVTAGVHGNEPAGLEAIGRVLQTLHRCDAPLRGRVVALRGNLGALAVGIRYLSRDLNRGWSASAIAAIRAATQSMPGASVKGRTARKTSLEKRAAASSVRSR